MTPELVWLQPEWLLSFGIIALRLTVFLLVLPTFPGMAMGIRGRSLAALWLAWVLQMSSPLETVSMSLSFAIYELTASAVMGMILGFSVRLALDALHFGGEVLGINIGLGMAGVMDPNTGTRENPVSRLLVMGGAVAMLTADLHLVVLGLLRRSFTWRPDVELLMFAPLSASRMIEGGVRLGLPVVGMATLLYLLFGVLARVAPQVQIFQIAYSVTILAGLSILAIEAPHVPALVESFLQLHLQALAETVG